MPRLTDLDPHWWGESGRVLGLSFLCPHCRTCRLGIAFANPVDGGLPSPIVADVMPASLKDHLHTHRTFDVPPGYLWQRTGDTFEQLTLSPSIDASKAGHWHGVVTNSEVT
jgi:Family of unknown function (DUF6527)